MTNIACQKGPAPPAPQDQIDAEMLRVAAAAGRPNLVEGSMRLRAMGEINAALTTKALVQLAATVRTSRKLH
jgi:hypothetical protein